MPSKCRRHNRLHRREQWPLQCRKQRFYKEPNTKTALPLFPILVVVSLILGGCGASKTDVTHSPRYKFSTFAGTVWRTKVKLSMTDVKEYTGAHHLYLLAPDSLDPASAHYLNPNIDRVVGMLPAGTRIRIERLWLYNGEARQFLVTASLDDGAYPKKVVYVNWTLLASNIFLGGKSMSRTWGVNPKYLESVAPKRKPRK